MSCPAACIAATRPVDSTTAGNAPLSNAAPIVGAAMKYAPLSTSVVGTVIVIFCAAAAAADRPAAATNAAVPAVHFLVEIALTA